MRGWWRKTTRNFDLSKFGGAGVKMHPSRQSAQSRLRDPLNPDMHLIITGGDDGKVKRAGGGSDSEKSG
jgi:hypothetical protein